MYARTIILLRLIRRAWTTLSVICRDSVVQVEGAVGEAVRVIARVHGVRNVQRWRRAKVGINFKWIIHSKIDRRKTVISRWTKPNRNNIWTQSSWKKIADIGHLFCRLIAWLNRKRTHFDTFCMLIKLEWIDRTSRWTTVQQNLPKPFKIPQKNKMNTAGLCKESWISGKYLKRKNEEDRISLHDETNLIRFLLYLPRSMRIARLDSRSIFYLSNEEWRNKQLRFFNRETGFFRHRSLILAFFCPFHCSRCLSL